MALAFLISAGSSEVSSYSSCWISSRSFFLMCAGIRSPVAGSEGAPTAKNERTLNLHYKAGVRVQGSGVKGQVLQATVEFDTKNKPSTEPTPHKRSCWGSGADPCS